MQVEIVNKITEKEFEAFDEKASKTTFSKQGMIITVGDNMYMRSKEGEYYAVKKEVKPLGVSFNRYYRQLYICNMEEYVDFNLTYFNLDTEETEIVTYNTPLEVANYLEDMADTIRQNVEDYYKLKAKLEMLSHTLLPMNQN